MWKLHLCEPERFTTEELIHRYPFPSENIQKNDQKPKTVKNRAKTITVSSLSLWLQYRLLEGLNDFGFLQSETNVWVSSVTAETAAASDGLAGERSTSWNYFEAVICICPGKHAKSNWDIVQNPPGDPHISGSLFLQRHCCIPLKVISITGKLALAIPRRVCSWLVSHLWNTRGSCAGMAGIWMSPHLQLLELLVFDSHPEITPSTRKGLEMEISLQDLNTKSRVTIVSLAVLNRRTIWFYLPADQSQEVLPVPVSQVWRCKPCQSACPKSWGLTTLGGSTFCKISLCRGSPSLKPSQTSSWTLIRTLFSW